MRKIVLTFGFAAGAVLAAMMALTLPFQERIGYDKALIVGLRLIEYRWLVVEHSIVIYGG